MNFETEKLGLPVANYDGNDESARYCATFLKNPALQLKFEHMSKSWLEAHPGIDPDSDAADERFRESEKIESAIFDILTAELQAILPEGTKIARREYLEFTVGPVNFSIGTGAFNFEMDLSLKEDMPTAEMINILWSRTQLVPKLMALGIELQNSEANGANHFLYRRYSPNYAFDYQDMGNTMQKIKRITDTIQASN